MKILLLFFSLVLFSGCASTWDVRRQELKTAYDEGKINADTYSKLKADIDKEEFTATDPYGAQLAEVEELFKAGKITASEYIQAKQNLTKARLEHQSQQYESSQKVAEDIRQESERQTEEFNKQEQQKFDNQVELIKAVRGNRITTDCQTDSFGNTHCQ